MGGRYTTDFTNRVTVVSNTKKGITPPSTILPTHGWSVDMIKPKHPTNAAQHAHMRRMQALNKASCLSSSAESWMLHILSRSGLKWSRQAQWGYRLFDFWCHPIGIAVEVDGPEHRVSWDLLRDEYNYRRSGIVVLRVRNFNEEDAAEALSKINSSVSWNLRRSELGLKLITT